VREYVAISDAAELEGQFARLEKTGVAGVKIDLKNRTDQQMIQFRRQAAKTAAEHHLMVEFQNGPTPDGIERTWPNVVSREDAAFKRLLASLN
jgi:alpha-glucosidase